MQQSRIYSHLASARLNIHESSLATGGILAGRGFDFLHILGAGRSSGGTTHPIPPVVRLGAGVFRRRQGGLQIRGQRSRLAIAQI
jgi:hypothetical protein